MSISAPLPSSFDIPCSHIARNKRLNIDLPIFIVTIFNKSPVSFYYSGHDLPLLTAWPCGRHSFRDCGHWRRHHDHSRADLFLSYEPAQGPGNVAGSAAVAHWRTCLLGVLQGRKCGSEGRVADRPGLSCGRIFRRTLGPAPAGSGFAQGVWHFAGNHWHPVTTVTRIIALQDAVASCGNAFLLYLQLFAPGRDHAVIQMISRYKKSWRIA